MFVTKLSKLTEPICYIPSEYRWRFIMGDTVTTVPEAHLVLDVPPYIEDGKPIVVVFTREPSFEPTYSSIRTVKELYGLNRTRAIQKTFDMVKMAMDDVANFDFTTKPLDDWILVGPSTKYFKADLLDRLKIALYLDRGKKSK